MPTAYPQIDATLCSAWNEIELDAYNSYSFYLAKYEIQQRKTWACHTRAVGRRPWTRNMGPTMRLVRKERSPFVRQTAEPRELQASARKDVIDVREMFVEATLKHQKFESRIFPFINSFQDFLTDHISFESKDILAQKLRFEELFTRWAIFQFAPHVMYAGKATSIAAANVDTNVPVWDGKDMSAISTSGKNTGWVQSIIPQVKGPLNLDTIFQADSFLREDVRSAPWSGGSSMPSDNQRLGGTNLLVLDNEAYNQLRFDPFMLANRRLDLDVVTDGFKGLPGGNVVCRVEDLALRYTTNTTYGTVGTLASPEERVLGSAQYNKNESIVTDAFRNAGIGVAFMYAAEGFQAIEAGPPPKDFVGQSEPKGFKDMFWNGEIKLIKPGVIPCTDENGAATFDDNSYGEYVKFICHLVLGLVAVQRRNVLPIFYLRQRGL